MKRIANFLFAVVLVAAFGATAIATQPVTAKIKQATVSTSFDNATGFDACTTPTTSQMATWWSNTHYFVYFMYLPTASNRANCGGATLSASWLSTVFNQGWEVVPLWVGPQMPYGACQTHSTYNSYISLTTSTAYNQGVSEAQKAVSEMATLGIPDTSTPPVAYDLEAYNNVASCRTAARYFMNGWDTYLSESPSQHSGVYGSTCGSYLSDFATTATIAHPPQFIFGADWDGNQNVNVMSCISSSYWSGHRDKQYKGGHNETNGGVTLNIDSDCSDSWVTGTFGGVVSSPGCTG